MRELIDCHIHTERCGHAVGTVDDYVRAAVARGLVGMVITEHLALPEELDPERRLAMKPCDMEDYLVEVDLTRQRYPEIELVTGIEADFLPGREQMTRDALAEAKSRSDGVTVVLGSVHFLGTWAFDDPFDLAEWDRHDVDDVWREYFAVWGQAVRSGMFDVMAHPDLPKKFGHRPAFDPAEMYAQAAATAAEAGVRVEVSTAGLRKPVGELYPGPDLLAAFRSAGVGATVGSDAHAPGEVGWGIEIAYDALAAAGFESVLFPDGRGQWKEISL